MAAGADVRGAQAKLARLGRQVQFATAVALTATAKAAQAKVTEELPRRFDRPNPFTMRAIGITPAKRDALVATVFVKPDQAKYLGIQEKGGTRKPEPGRPINLPVKLRTDSYGNIPRRFWSQIDQLRARKAYVGSQTYSTKTKRLVSSYGGGIFIANGKDPRTKHLPPGIYERPMVGRQRAGGLGTKGKLQRAGERGQQRTGLKLLVAVEKRAAYVPRFQFRRTVEEAARQVFGAEFRNALERALATAR